MWPFKKKITVCVDDVIPILYGGNAYSFTVSKITVYGDGSKIIEGFRGSRSSDLFNWFDPKTLKRLIEDRKKYKESVTTRCVEI